MKRGIDCKVYLNIGTYEAPSWSELDIISEFQPKRAWDVFDVVIRRSRVKMGIKTVLDLSCTGTLMNEPDNSNYEAMIAALQSDDPVDLLVLDGPHDEDGCIGFRCDYQLMSMDESQNPGDGLMDSINFVPTPTSHYPSWAEIESGVPVFTEIRPQYVGDDA